MVNILRQRNNKHFKSFPNLQLLMDLSLLEAMFSNCDAKIQYVTTSGQFFSASGAPPAKKHRSSSCTRNIPHNMAPVEPSTSDAK
uniref:NR LBD domain-containing protein n=1 Tax=Heterorhabditis bacteriophora TaxID=37862 RepID=A0A1I7W8Q2_HETBA